MVADAAMKYLLGLPCEPEEQLIWLPSDFDPTELLTYKLENLAEKQAKLVQGKLFDLVRALKHAIIALTAARDRKKKNARGQDANTRALSDILEIQGKRNELLLDYRFLREMLSKLAALDQEDWPALGLQDTYRKSTEQRREPGSSKITEGALWLTVGVPRVNQGTGDAEEVLSSQEEVAGDDTRLYGESLPLYLVHSLFTPCSLLIPRNLVRHRLTMIFRDTNVYHPP